MSDKDEIPPPSLAAPQIPAADGHEDYDQDGGQLRYFARSPHPYHRQKFELLHPSDKLAPQSCRSSTSSSSPSRSAPGSSRLNPPSALSSPFVKESTPTSDSGTDADDEHFLKGLPAPRTRQHKGLRGRNEPLSGASTPLLPPDLLEEEGRKAPPGPRQDVSVRDRRVKAEKTRRKKEIIRRAAEALILFSLGAILYSNRNVKPIVNTWRKELTIQGLLAAVLVTVYPFRVAIWAYTQGTPSRQFPLAVPTSFDPGPLFYPPTIPIYVALLLSPNNQAVILPNLILSLASLPRALVPLARSGELCDPAHWLLSTVPLIASGLRDQDWELGRLGTVPITETAVLLYPLHQNLCVLLQQLTTTSLLPAELQLLSILLVNILLFSTSPQMVILTTLIWGGGLALLVLCGHVIRWGITLARVPKWRFKRPSHASGPNAKQASTLLRHLFNLITVRGFRYELFGADYSDDEYCALSDAGNHEGRYSSDMVGGDMNMDGSHEGPFSLLKSFTLSPDQEDDGMRLESSVGPTEGFSILSTNRLKPRRHTLPTLTGPGPRSKTHTPSGRRKRSASSSIRAFFSLTYAQATARKWAYAIWMYICIVGIILGGVRAYVSKYALQGEEPVGWALGYLFGDLPWFRLQVVKANLERWICLPPRWDEDAIEQCSSAFCRQGWAEHLRHAVLGEANTRLLLSAYWLVIIVVGLGVVFKLTPIYEVDTRRKVFHFMMVGMLLPATYVDPSYVALALALVLAIFLLLDLIRASQLPPLSKPIASFLTPYVDGRDLRGPVVISHIFLLIGCSIPLWLSLAALGSDDAADDERHQSPLIAGWELPTRDVSMVSGVVCVGLGDAAASLIGRRWGHRKWVWGGGKSLEGSLAFAVAVFLGLATAGLWLRIGGWSITGESLRDECTLGIWPCSWRWLVQDHLRGWVRSLRGAAVCGSMASLTEAVLTGGNDNVIVPVVLWTCVKSLGV
ncbi:hypothetical protein MCOR25_006183 [Pyricularia grisea]|uniref:dolichol kinase n=1 Tax=Pyricularia grisea TaxID=148305 RepID=A0A6P8BLJ8_PYRGI|nr:uncharacterized protein PgNI_01521 [Pyricularia grisea]KAI6362548.1 hypothetical protein MCOR25_006183 [Pyricularia grisea]TLD17746.1 hypothetical protein PgNI_01521 [Pyricularia grisea]